MKRITAGLVLMILSGAVSPAATIDVYPGTGTYPTVKAGVDAAQPGDVVRIHAGVYPENISLPRAGTEGNYITIMAADGEEVIMDGADPITGWTKCASAAEAGGNPDWANIWYADAPIIPALNINVYEGDDLLALGQYPFPNDPFFDRQSSEFKRVPSSGYTATTISDAAVFPQTADDFWNGAFIYVYARPNRVYGRVILDYTGSTHTVKYSGVPEGADASYDKYAVANHPVLIDAAGKYAYNQSQRKMWIWPKSTASLESGAIRMSKRSNALYISAKPYIKIDGIRFRQYSNSVIYARMGCDNLDIRNCEIYHGMSDTRAHTIYVSDCDNGFIYKNYVHDNKNCGGTTMSGGTDNMVAENIYVRNGATCLIFYGQNDSWMLNNEVREHVGVHANGLTSYETNRNITLAGNRVYDGNNALTFQQTYGMVVKNNIFHSPGSWAVACWNGATSSGIKMYHNLILGSNGSGNGFYSQGGNIAGFEVKNNIVTSHSTTAGGTWQNNLFINNETTLGTGDFVETDKSKVFVDFANRDYHLVTGSPAIDAGVDVGVVGDIESLGRPVGGKPDIGPHEFGGVLDVKETDETMRERMTFRLPTPLHREAIPALVKAGFDLQIYRMDGTPLLPGNVRGGQAVLVRFEGSVQAVTVVE